MTLRLPSYEYEGLQRSPLRYGVGSSRARGPFGGGKIARVPESLSPDEETLQPAPSVTGAAHGPGGTGGTTARVPAAVGRGDQADIDFQAERAIENRYLTRLQDIRTEQDLIGDPQDREILARTKTRAIEDLMPAGSRSSLKATLRPGLPMSEVDYGTPPPEAPTIGELRQRRSAGVALAANPAVAVEGMKQGERSAERADADNEIEQYKRGVAMIRADGKGNVEGRIQMATNILNAKLAKLGLRQPTPIDPLRVPSY